MKHYVELITVAKGKLTLTTLEDVLTHDLDVLSYLRPKERYGWIEVHAKNVVINDDFQGDADEKAEWCMKSYGVYIRVVDTCA